MLTLYSKETTSFSTLGIGVLRDFISHPLITEELNGAYTLEFEYAKDGYLSEYLIEQNIIKANGQAFRIWNIKKDMQKITVLAKHIFFDLSFNFLADVFPTNLTAQSALAWMLNRAAVATNFSATGNCTQTSSTRYVRKNFIDAVFNEDNALLKKFGGELSYDNFNITVHEHRGTNANFSIRYKKNLTGIDFNLDFSNIATRIVPIGFDGLTIDSTYVESPRASNYFTPLYKTYEFNDIKYDPDDEEAYHTLAEAKQALINAANELFTKNVDLPQVSIGVNFVELSKCSEYASYSNLETVYLGDTIDVIIPELNIHTSARVNKTVYDCILERFITLEIGSAKQSITRSQIVIENQIRKSENYLTQAQQNAENLINHPFNGNVLIDKENGVIYLMDSTSPATAQNVWKWSLGGLGFSSTGINGTYTVAILQDGRINADFITTGQLNTGVIQGYDSLLIQVDTLDREFQKEINPTDIASGSSISLDDSAETELVNFELEGKTEQETTTGKNFFNIGDITTSGILVVSDTGLTLTKTADARFSPWYSLSKEIPAGSYKVVSTNSGNYNDTPGIQVRYNNGTATTFGFYGNNANFTLTSAVNQIRFYLGSGTTTGYYFTSTNLMFIKSDVTDTSYEKYTGTIPSPNPDYPSELVNVGYENLINKEQIILGYFRISDGTYLASTSATYKSTELIPVSPSTKYYSNVVAFSSSAVGVTYWNDSGTFISGSALSSNHIYTTPSNAKYMRLSFKYANSDITDIDTLYLTKGVEQHSYIPYGKYGIEIKNVGKNLWELENSYTSPSGSQWVLADTPINKISAGTYTLSLTKSVNENVFFSFKNSSNQATIIQLNNVEKNTVTFTSDMVKAAIYVYGSQEITISNIQLEKGNQATNYEAYKSNSQLYTLDQPLRSIGNVKDLLYIKNGVLYVERKIGSVIFNGTETGWNKYGAYGSAYLYYIDNKTDGVTIDTNKVGYGYAKCNYFPWVFYTDNTAPPPYIRFQYDNGKRVYIGIDSNLSLNDFKTWLSTHNTEVINVLATPTVENLGEVEIPSTYEGITYINTTDNLEPNMNIEYVRNTTLSNYVEGQVNRNQIIEERHYSELKLTEEGITSRVETTEIATDELSGRMNAVEIEQTSQQATINILGTNIDLTNGEVREVTTTTGFTFNAEGMTISDSDSNFRALHRKDGTYYYDGENVVGQYTKDGSKQKDLELFGVYTYGKASINSPSMFIAQLYTDSNGEVGMGHFYNGGE